VPTLVEILTPLGPRVEAELKPRLKGFLGSFIVAYLPQHWVFETEKGKATVQIRKDGSVLVVDGAVSTPDVTVKAPHEKIEAVLLRGERPHGGDDIAVDAHTAKGRAALEQVRGRFGL
jgi:hypothetical protein